MYYWSLIGIADNFTLGILISTCHLTHLKNSILSILSSWFHCTIYNFPSCNSLETKSRSSYFRIAKILYYILHIFEGWIDHIGHNYQ